MIYMNIGEIEQKLKLNLKPERYRHTLGVAYTAASLAMAFDGDIQKAYRAGLLHDCAKGYSLEQQRAFCEEYNINLDGILTDSPQLMHSALAPFIAKDYYEEHDSEILDAIECHTTGKPEMNPLDQMIFIADYIEPNRKIIPGLFEIRKMAFQNLDQCTLEILDHTIEFLKGKKQKIGYKTIETYEYYLKKTNA